MPRSASPKRFVVRCICTVAAAAALAAAGEAPAGTRHPIAGPDVLTGKPLALSQFRRKPVFVNVWASWCYGCRTEAPTLAHFARVHAQRVAFLGINTHDSQTSARAFYRRFRLPYRSIWDPRELIAGSWARGAPTTLVFNRRHVLVQRIEGTASVAQLQAALLRVT